MASLLSLSDVTAGYDRRRPILRGVSFAVGPGSITALLGLNGSGKSTLLRVLAGALPFAGSIRLLERDFAGYAPRERARHLALVPQTFGELLPLTVEEMLRIGMYPATAAESSGELIAQALAALRIEPLRARQFISLSGGEQRKSLIAQGLIQLADRPGVLLLDEPVAFLDPPAQQAMLELLRSTTSGRQVAVVVVLHDVELARRCADQIVLLRHGRLLDCGRPETVLTEPNLTALYAPIEDTQEAA